MQERIVGKKKKKVVWGRRCKNTENCQVNMKTPSARQGERPRTDLSLIALKRIQL